MAASLSVSLCVPTWEPGAAHLGALLASIRAQALDDLEVVVSDDASSTDVAGLVEEAAGGLDVRVVRQPRRLGMVANWNAAAALAGGDLMMVLGQDDELGPGMLAQYLRELAA